jgi:hypothetical protein
MSNTFVTPRAVTTIAQSRIDYNQSLTSLLQNFSSSGAPNPNLISLEGVTGFKTGMFWYKSGTTSSDGQGRLFVYNGSNFSRNGIGTFRMASVSAANAAAAAGSIEYGDLILTGSDELYIVNAAGSAIKRVGDEAITLSGLTASQFLRSDIETTASANVFFNSNNFVKIPTGTTAQRPDVSRTAPGQIRFNLDLNIFEGRTTSSWQSLGAAVPVANSSNFTANVIFTSATAGTDKYVNSSLTFNPSTGTLSATAFNSTSDQRLKENIRLIPTALAKLDNISGYLFNLIGNPKDSAGVIAQEVRNAFPEAVEEAPNGMLQVNYSAVLALVLQAFNEYRSATDARIENLERNIDDR